MKKKILFILSALVGVTLMSCEPQRDDFKLEGLMNPADIKLSAEGRTQAGSNGVVLHVADGVVGGWFYNGKPIGVGDGVYTVLRSEGSHEFTFLQTSNAGLVEVKTSYNVTVMDVELPPLEVTVWQGNAPIDGKQPIFDKSTGADWSALEVGNTIQFTIEPASVGWGQFIINHNIDWSAAPYISIGGGYAEKTVERVADNATDVDNIKNYGFLTQGSGFTITKVMIIK
ncbi:MAG: hypothetical protein LBM63_02710 [Rikenellaceae bacterium]|jgi:hypothetical protein|nr:hypothetical protein [Rikenellaceae bacterium]